MGPDDHSITLRLRHPSIDPDIISRELGLTPQHAWRAGEPRQAEAGETATGVYRETYWVGLLQPLPPDEAAATRHLATAEARAALAPYSLLFALLKMKRSSAFWRGFVEEGGTIHCLLEVHDAERFHLELPPALSFALSDLRVTFAIEVDVAGSQAAAA